MGAFEARFSGRLPQAPLFAAVDIGAGKVACLIARAAHDPDIERPLDRIDMIGVGCVPVRRKASDGPDGDTHARLARVAIDQAVRMAGDVAAPFAAAYAGPDLASTPATGTVRLKRGEVGPRDVAGAIAAARAQVDFDGRRLLHAAPVRYRIDGGAPVIDPRGLAGTDLSADVCLTHAPAENVAALEAALEAAFARPAFLVAAPFAAGHGVLTAEERQAGAIVVDIGENGAGIAIFSHGGLVHAETLPGGGARLTLDLAARLGTTFAVAERAKCVHGGLTGDHDPGEAVEVPVIGGDGRLEPGMALHGAFAEALVPRLEEIFARIASRLDLAGYGAEASPLGVALTGGVSQTPGLRMLAARAMQRPVRIGQPLDCGGLEDGAGGAAFAVAAGLVRCGLERAVETAPVRARAPIAPMAPAIDAPAVRRKVGSAVTWIKENF